MTTTWDFLQHRRLDVDEASLVQRPRIEVMILLRDETPRAPAVGDQVDVSLA